MRLFIFITLLSVLLNARIHEAAGERYTFDDAQRYCKEYADGWRTLHIRELFELRGDKRFSRGYSFWSANSVVSGPSKGSTGSEGDAVQTGEVHGYSSYLQDGDVSISPVEKKMGILCTDTPLKAREPSFDKTADGVIDRESGILWQPLDATGKKVKYDFESAQEACESLGLRGREWRLPTLDELYGIVSYKHARPTVDTALFGVMMSRYYWSDDEFGEKQAYVVGFKLGSVATSDKRNRSYVRCVSDLEE